MGILDKGEFPLGEPMAQELLRIMAHLYLSEPESLRFVARFGIDVIDIRMGRSAIDRWQDLLDRLAKKGKLRAAVKATRDEYADNERAPFLDALLADKAAPVSAEPLRRRGGGGPDDPGFDDAAIKKEALLFFDDLTLPVGEVPNLISALMKVIALAPAICLLRAQNVFGEFYGTGFRISKNLVLTNHHVLFPKNTVATKVQADFGFDVDANGASLAVTSLPGAVQTITGEEADDWAVIKVENMNARWPVLPLNDAPTPKVGDRAYILQHPRAQKKRLGFVRNTITDVKEGVIRYLTDTEPGSSGAPVFDMQGCLIALHHAGGDPIEVPGKPPVAKNEGIRISRVLARLKVGNLLQ
jgi:S1-C subfamily serine protease